jgi:hypothetical protein
VAGELFLASWPADCVIRYTVDADKHPVAAPTVVIAASDGPVTSSTTNSGGTRHQWHAIRPNAAGHIEILSSLPNMPMGLTPLLRPWQQVLLVARTR